MLSNFSLTTMERSVNDHIFLAKTPFPQDDGSRSLLAANTAATPPLVPRGKSLIITMPGTFPTSADIPTFIHSNSSTETTCEGTSVDLTSNSSQMSPHSITHELSAVSDNGDSLEVPAKHSQGKKCKKDKKNKLDKAARQAAFLKAHGPAKDVPPKPELLYKQLARDMLSSGVQLSKRKTTDADSLWGGSSGASTPMHGGEASESKRSLHHAKSVKHKTDGTLSQKQRRRDIIFTLDDFEAMLALQGLFVRYGGASHMGILDRSYSFFVNKARTGGLYFKVHDKVAVVGGDPLCPPDQYHQVLTEFKEYRKRFRWRMAFLGASDTFVEYAREQKWSSIQFGIERVLNPLDNPVLLEQSGKRIISQSRQLLDPDKSGLTLHVYSPAQGENHELQAELVGIYDDWRRERDETRSHSTQAFITVYDPFSLPSLMVYIYTRDSHGVANGFAALRSTGATGGYHIDPYIAAPGAPRGVSDLLIFASMALLNNSGIDNLSLGFEPLEEIGAAYGLGRFREKIIRTMYKKTFTRLPLQGKRAYHNKFRPDESKGSGLHLVFADGPPKRKHMIALAHTANIKIKRMIFNQAGFKADGGRAQPEPEDKTDKD